MMANTATSLPTRDTTHSKCLWKDFPLTPRDMHHHSQSMGGVRRTSHMRVNMSKRAIYLLLPPTARMKELESWSKEEEEETKKAWWEGWWIRETAKMTDRCFSLLFWTFLAVSLQPAMGLSVLSQSLKDFDRRAFPKFSVLQITPRAQVGTHTSPSHPSVERINISNPQAEWERYQRSISQGNRLQWKD